MYMYKSQATLNEEEFIENNVLIDYLLLFAIICAKKLIKNFTCQSDSYTNQSTCTTSFPL